MQRKIIVETKKLKYVYCYIELTEFGINDELVEGRMAVQVSLNGKIWRGWLIPL